MKKGIIVLLHGLGGSADDFNDLAKLLPKEFEIVEISIPGHANPETLRDIDFTEMFRILVDQLLKYKNIIFVGHSFGSILALALAKILKPKALILMSTPCHFAWYEKIGIDFLSCLPWKLPSGAGIEHQIRKIFRKECTFENRSHLYYYGKSLKKYMDFTIDTMKNLNAIRCPVLLLCGKNDKVINTKNSNRIFHLLPCKIKKEVVCIDTGHMMLAGLNAQNTLINILSFIDHIGNYI